MAYSIRYTANFSDHHDNKYSVKLYQDGFGGSSKEIKIQDATFEYKKNENFIVSALTLKIVNTFEKDEFDDLLDNTIREWKIVVTEYDDALNEYFTGWNVVDVAEVEDRPDAIISVTFNDELIKLKDINVIDSSVGAIYDLLSIIRSGLSEIDNQYIYINNSLFYYDHTKTAGNTLFEQTYLSSDYLYENNVETKPYWDVINDILSSFNSYLYRYKGDYYIERYSDVSVNTNWATVNTSGAISSESTKLQKYNKQNDFFYVYDIPMKGHNPGISDFELDVVYNDWNSLVPSRWNLDEIEETPYYYYAAGGGVYVTDVSKGNSELNTWYLPEGTTDISIGWGKYGMNSYITWDPSGAIDTAQNETSALFYRTYIPVRSGNSGDSDAYTLQLKWKIKIEDTRTYNVNSNLYVRFSMRVCAEHSYDGYYIVEDGDGNASLSEQEPFEENKLWEVKVQETSPLSKIIEFSKDIDLTPIKADLSRNEQIIFGFYPLWTDEDTDGGQPTVIMGDIEITAKGKEEENKYKFRVNEGFVKKEKDTIKLHDIPNYMYNNGLYLSDKTRTFPKYEFTYLGWRGGWTETAGAPYYSVIEHFAQSKIGYRYINRKTYSFKSLFKEHTFIKPLSIMSDDKYVGKDFIIFNYKYNMPSSIYTIKADEFSNDKNEIVINE